MNLEAREAMVTDLVQNVVKTASNLISDSSEIRQSWSDLSSDELGRAATALLVGLEENAFLLHDSNALSFLLPVLMNYKYCLTFQI